MRESKDTIIVTGSTGFIGSALIKKFAGRFALVGFDRMTTHQPQPLVACIYIDNLRKFDRSRSATCTDDLWKPYRISDPPCGLFRPHRRVKPGLR
jgi:nucleoside-diphosphate-sugar epimerase